MQAFRCVLHSSPNKGTKTDTVPTILYCTRPVLHSSPNKGTKTPDCQKLLAAFRAEFYIVPRTRGRKLKYLRHCHCHCRVLHSSPNKGTKTVATVGFVRFYVLPLFYIVPRTRGRKPRVHRLTYIFL